MVHPDIGAAKSRPAPPFPFRTHRLRQRDDAGVCVGWGRAGVSCAAGSTANDVAILLNAAYAVLMNDTAHRLYVEDVQRFREDTGGTFTDRPVSAWSGPPDEQRAVFVDESVCIGCRNCTHAAPETFAMVRMRRLVLLS